MANKDKATKMIEDLDDCANIASAALVLAVERSMDLTVPIPITLMMLRKLCDFNVQAQMDQAVPKPLVEIAGEIGINVDKIMTDAITEMQVVVDKYFDLRKLEQKRVESL